MNAKSWGLVLLTLAAAACNRQAPAAPRSSGYVEATEVRVSSEVGGRVLALRAEEGKKVAAGAKRGFCFYDSHPYQRSLPRAPAKRAYPKNSCGTRDSVRLLMGISVGWLDAYFWRLPDQYIDVTKVPNGKYRLAATVDAAGWFKESNERNNRTWANLEITATGIKVLRYGPPPA